MFTGIVALRGTLIGKTTMSGGLRLHIQATRPFVSDINIGDSIAVNGVCLTATEVSPDAFKADVMVETLKATHFEGLKVGQKLNLEKALPLGGRLGGHLVTGHVDGQSRLLEKRTEGIATRLRFEWAAVKSGGLLHKGSVAINGVSLTIQALTPNGFEVSLIPHTMALTGLNELNVGEQVHVETDVIGKYVAQLLGKVSEAQSFVEDKEETSCLNSAALTAFLMA